MLRTPLFKPEVDLNETTALIGAIFNASLQVGSLITLAIVTAITSKSSSDPSIFVGYRAGWWFVIAMAGTMAIVAAISLRVNAVVPEQLPEIIVEDKEAN